MRKTLRDKINRYMLLHSFNQPLYNIWRQNLALNVEMMAPIVVPLFEVFLRRLQNLIYNLNMETEPSPVRSVLIPDSRYRHGHHRSRVRDQYARD